MMEMSDEASMYLVAVLLPSNRSAAGLDIERALKKQWVSWAGSPERLQSNSHRAHMSDAARGFCAGRLGAEGRLTAPEEHDANSRVENRTAFYKTLL